MRSAGKTRRDEIVISRMRFGHTRLNSTLYKMGKHDTGRCEFCGQEESVEHVILYCQKYETERRILMQNLEKIKMQFKLRDQGRSHGCARVCRCHPQWQLAHLKTDAE